MSQNLWQFKTQTVTHTLIGHNGADRTGRLFRGPHPLSSVRNTTLRWRCGMPVRIWCRCGSFSEGKQKRYGRRRSRVRRASVRVFYLFYLRLVLLPHHVVRGTPSSRWWAERNGAGRSGRGFPICSCPFLLLIFSHRLVDYTLKEWSNMSEVTAICNQKGSIGRFRIVVSSMWASPGWVGLMNCCKAQVKKLSAQS